ncbi:MAG: GntR family transcriptional regulator, partial [Eubacteriales bacterium]|nr:GntR family transcriptional regulator [Eubacteriales bacterium]
MPKSKYDKIYFTLKQRIETEVYEYQQLLPSENTLVQEFSCSRNTIRRAIQALLADGYVQALKGKGVRVIFQKAGHSHFLLSGIESFPEAAARNAVRQHTKVIHFEERLTDAKLSKKTGIPEGTPIYYIQRVRFLDDIPLILDHNYFVREATEGLTKEMAEQSVYQYLENQLNMVIT